ncbi:E3 ubiquitin-protein ligase TRIM35-like [Alosa sapidissima]|uniref:E3 ubiquitin-protein ligase TRIM35-like n=1 Tax=Alosa sapidissima TaxID=34773 RepID=UPI001C08B3BF|nr:E3 ubiquitin-protein ligase TRIM35-like [Alosa sapidissima]
MAGRPSLTEEDFSCPVCCDVFRDPVLLACSHSICRPCVLRFWGQRRERECPVCRCVSANPEPPSNIVLRGMCEAILEEKHQRVEHAFTSAGVCGTHGAPLTHFYEDEKRPACVKCRVSKKHSGHRFRPVEEAATEHKKELRIKLKPLQDKLKSFEEFKQNFEQTAEYIKNQAEQTEHLIKEEFKKLHQFLREEEAFRLAALKEEDEQNSQMMKKKIDELDSEIASLLDKIQALEEELGAEDLSFLQNYKAMVERIQYSPQDPEPVSGELLINVAKHLGNLMFEVSQKLQTMVPYNPVALDPNTAHADLIVSADLTSMTFSEERQLLPCNPERFSGYTSVLGSLGFTSGMHGWDVEVGDSTAWAVGVIAESVYRKKNTNKFGLWYVGFYNGKYGKGYSPEILTLLRVSQKIQKIRVQLDCDKGKVTFTDAGRNTCLYVFKHNFTETVYPYFYSHCKLHPLRIVPVRSFVTVEQFSS